MRRRVSGRIVVAACAAVVGGSLLEVALAPAWLSPSRGVRDASRCGRSAGGDGESVGDGLSDRWPTFELPNRRAATLGVAQVAAGIVAALGGAGVARALVKGNAPPTGYGKKTTKDRACGDIVECREMGFAKETEEFGSEMTYQKTPSGIRYKDMVPGDASAGVAKVGSKVQLRYRVMRSGKRSSDGLSGEASTIFSLGFGEDDGPKDAVLTTQLGEGKLVKALDEGLVGLAVGGLRRVQVRPENGLGWRKPGKCAEPDMATGALTGLPGAGAEREETCIDTDKLPLPLDYGAQRRFGRRFDESLIVEVELAGLAN